MRVDATGPSESSPQVHATERVSLEVPLTRTPTARAEMRAALERAETRLTGHAPSHALLDLVTAQASLETGSGRSMYNFNFGGIKGTSPSGMTAVSGTHEWEGNTRYHTQAHFRAYGSLDEGAQDYLSLLHRRYGGAIAAAEMGDVDGFAHALKARGYFTGPEARYANDLRGLLGLPRRPVDATLPDGAIGSTPGADAIDQGFSSTQELALLMSAVSMSAARIAAPQSEDEE